MKRRENKNYMWNTWIKNESDKFRQIGGLMRSGKTIRSEIVRNFSKQKCVMCGAYMVLNEKGKLSCSQCGCTISKIDWWEND